MYKIFIKKERLVARVTDYYLETVGQALKDLGYQVRYGYDWDPDRTDLAVTCTATSAVTLAARKIPYLYWAQGIWPEESLMRHGSRLRFRLTSFLEKRALAKAEFVFFVSDAMRAHYEKKYGLSFEDRCYIMPCSNEELHSGSFDTPGKYESSTFCYVGGLSPWQCFEETLELYSRIEKELPGAKLLLYVPTPEAARPIAEKYGIRNYELDYVPVEELPQRLAGVKYGFVLRKDDPINQVATPTKVVSYLASGIIPIYSRCMSGIRSILRDSRYAVALDPEDTLSDLLETFRSPIQAKEVRKDIENIFRKHYDRQLHIQQIGDILQDILD